MMTETKLDPLVFELNLLEALKPTVRHHVLVCTACAMRYPTTESMVGDPISTICGKMVIFVMPERWCEPCKDVVMSREYEGICGVCERDIYFHE